MFPIGRVFYLACMAIQFTADGSFAKQQFDARKEDSFVEQLVVYPLTGAMYPLTYPIDVNDFVNGVHPTEDRRLPFWPNWMKSFRSPRPPQQFLQLQPDRVTLANNLATALGVEGLTQLASLITSLYPAGLRGPSGPPGQKGEKGDKGDRAGGGSKPILGGVIYGGQKGEKGEKGECSCNGEIITTTTWLPPPQTTDSPVTAPTTTPSTTDTQTTEPPSTNLPTTDVSPTNPSTTDATTALVPTTDAAPTNAPTTNLPTTDEDNFSTTQSISTDGPVTLDPTTDSQTTIEPTTGTPSTGPHTTTDYYTTGETSSATDDMGSTLETTTEGHSTTSESIATDGTSTDGSTWTEAPITTITPTEGTQPTTTPETDASTTSTEGTWTDSTITAEITTTEELTSTQSSTTEDPTTTEGTIITENPTTPDELSTTTEILSTTQYTSTVTESSSTSSAATTTITITSKPTTTSTMKPPLAPIIGCSKRIHYENGTWKSPEKNEDMANLPCLLTIDLTRDSERVDREPICQIRLDFDEFAIAQPDRQSNCVVDNFSVLNTENKVPVICGDNAGQHMFLMPTSRIENIVLAFTFGKLVIPRFWNIRITLLPCCAPHLLAPSDCLQYFQDIRGVVKSFNWNNPLPSDTTSIRPRQLANQDYNICIRAHSFASYVCYTPCRVKSGLAFSISQNSRRGPFRAGVGIEDCGDDFLLIANGYDRFDRTSRNDRFCGNIFNPNRNVTVDQQSLVSKASTTICSEIKPFHIHYTTDGTELADAGNNGFCLQYEQKRARKSGASRPELKPCWEYFGYLG